jgi:DNA polymerase-3 subunit beta
MFIASKSALAAALALSSDVVERRNTIPILANVAIERTDGGLRARATDLDTEAMVEFSATVAMDFQPFSVQAHLLRDIVRKIPDGADISAEAKEREGSPDSVTFKAGRSRFSLQALPPSDLSSMDVSNLPHKFTIPAKALQSAIAAVGFAISTEETRYYLNGIYMHPTTDGMLFVATDGHRLAKRIVMIDQVPADAPGVIIPRKTVATLAKILPKDGDVFVELSDARICFTVGGTRLVSKLIDGTFPDYVRVIPANNATDVTADAKAIASAVDRVSSVSTERGRAMKFHFSEGTLKLLVTNPDAGSAEDEVAYEGQAEMETGFNAKYVLEALEHLPEGTVRIALGESTSPTIFRADGDHQENLIVLMPMRV